jgi:hypothetical protein
MATAKTQTRKTGNTVEAKGDVKLTLPDARRGLYAYVGAADYAVEKIRSLPALQDQLIEQVKGIQSQVRELPQTLRTSLTELQGKVNETYVDVSGKVTGTYSELANRGEKVVTSIRKDPATTAAVDQAKTAKSQVKAARTSVRKAATEAGDAAESAADKF